MNMARFVVMLMILAGFLSACGGSSGGGGSTQAQACISGAGEQEVLSIMEQWYFWNDEADQISKYSGLRSTSSRFGSSGLDGFDDANDLLDYLRYRPSQFDRNFSYITTPAEEQAFFNEGEFAGYGFSLMRLGLSHEIRITQVYANSPAANAGLERGFSLLTINGRTIQQIDLAEGINEALGPSNVGVSGTFTLLDRQGVELPPVTMSKATVDLDPVSIVSVLEDDMGNPIAGYIFFRTFINTAVDDLRAAFVEFQQASVNDVIVDLRYNGGGLVAIAELLGSLLAGPGNVGNVFYGLEYNSQAAQFNFQSSFQSEPASIDLDNIVFITTDGSASASELLINGLSPYFDAPGKSLAVVGTPSYGKPVGQNAFDFCNDEHRLRAVTFKTVNVLGVGDYFSGLPVDCVVADDLSELLGDENEASLAAALNYIESGTCAGGTSTVQQQAADLSDKVDRMRVLGGDKLWQQFANAY